MSFLLPNMESHLSPPLSSPPHSLRNGMIFSFLENKDMMAASRIRNNLLFSRGKSPNLSVGNSG
jgi:hypothetical protein